ncbi:cupin domain-containing protein [Micromonospora parva]|uniref:cupin domain-containing protein n=1 Tax=Micromonospora parva TaxID=1464048 RepID=UPI00382BDF4D
MTALADGLLSYALTAPIGRGMRTVDGGRLYPLDQTMIALARGQRLDEHDNPGAATVQVLRGRVRVTVGDDTTDGRPGELLIMPGVRHTVTALEDAVVLLTVAEGSTPIPADAVDTDLAASYERQHGRRRWPVNASLPEPWLATRTHRRETIR